MSIYDYTVKGANGDEVSLSDYNGKVLLIVNTATGCGLTPQYKGLQVLYEKYMAKGFDLLDFPCNQFLKQAPGTNEEISSFCTLKYNTTFPRFAKIDVNGESADPLYKWLKTQKGGIFGSNIKWNFTKFLIDGKGEVIERYAPTTSPAALEKEIERALVGADG